jgi:hypothetical protein
MKTQDQVVDVAKGWMAEIGDLREKYPLKVVMRDNAGKDKSKALQEYFTSMGVENYYSTAYELWQDGLAEAEVKSTVMTATCGMAESSMVGKFWFKLQSSNQREELPERHGFLQVAHQFNTLSRTIRKREGCVPIQAVWMSSIHAYPRGSQ